MTQLSSRILKLTYCVICIFAIPIIQFYCVNIINPKAINQLIYPSTINTTQDCNEFKLSFECLITNNESLQSQQIFDNIYNKNLWKSDESRSGTGSNLQKALDTVLYLKNFIKQYNISSFADIPCGDTNWQFAIKELNTMQFYFGGDISSGVINENNLLYSQHKNKLFKTWDLVSCMVPQYYYNNILYNFDFVLSRDVLMHLSIPSGLKFVKNVVLSNVSYWGVTSYPGGKNKNMISPKVGDHYENDLEIYPFNLSKNNANIIFKEKSHILFPKGEGRDYLIIYKIDQKIKKFVKKYY